MKELPYRSFSPEEHETWRQLFLKQEPKRDEQIHDLFSEGIQELRISAEKVPNIYELNRKLENHTGFKGIPVEGLEEDISFFEMLTKRMFPIGNFIRDRRDLSYTPAPDVFHDLYGHMPFFIDRDYADFCVELGRRASRYTHRPEVIQQFGRLFWFGIEFSLIKTPQGRKIFGAGIASSHGECAYALSDAPEVIPFDIEKIRLQDFKIDEFQKRLFILDEPGQLYSCLPEFERRAAG